MILMMTGKGSCSSDRYALASQPGLLRVGLLLLLLPLLLAMASSTWGVRAGATTCIPGVDDYGEVKTPEEEAADLAAAALVEAAWEAACVAARAAAARAVIEVTSAFDAIAAEEAYIGPLEPPPFAELSPFYAKKCLRNRRRRHLEEHLFVGYRRKVRRARTPYMSSPVFRPNSGIASRFDRKAKDRVAARRDIGLSEVGNRHAAAKRYGGSLTRSPRRTEDNFVKEHFATSRYYLAHAEAGSNPWDRSRPSNVPTRGGASGGASQPHRIHRLGGMGARALHHERVSQQRRLRSEIKAHRKTLAQKAKRLEKCKLIYAKMNPHENTMEEEEEMKHLIDCLAADVAQLEFDIDMKSDLLGEKAPGDEGIDRLATKLHSLLVASHKSRTEEAKETAEFLGPGTHSPKHPTDLKVKRPNMASAFRANKVASGLKFVTNENPSPAKYDARRTRWFGGVATSRVSEQQTFRKHISKLDYSLTFWCIMYYFDCYFIPGGAWGQRL